MKTPAERMTHFVRTSGFEYLVRFLILVSVMGGPIVVYDATHHSIGKVAALALILPPTALIYLGAVSLHDPLTEWSTRPCLWVGLGSALVIQMMNVFAVWQLMNGQVPVNVGLTFLGVIVGTVATSLYAFAAIRILRAGEAR
jgi:hypothetical protein